MELFQDVQALLRDDLFAWLAHVQATYAWGNDARVALAAPGKLLATHTTSTRIPQGFWALLPYEVAHYCAASWEDTTRFRRLALACELLLCALDYFDELEDNDHSPTRQALGDGRLLNCATALYQEALQILTELDDSAEASCGASFRLTQIASRELRLAMSGQHLDLLSEASPWEGFSPEESLAIVEAKSGSLCRMVCRLACAASGAHEALSALFAEVGTHIGIAAQLENDIHGLEQELSAEGGLPSLKTDLLRAKKTFPLVLASSLPLQNMLPPADTSDQEGQALQWPLQVYYAALQQTWASALVHRFSAVELVGPIEQQRGKTFPPRLYVILGLDLDTD